MNKFLLAFLGILLFVNACKKDDKDPIIIFNGSPEITIELNSTWEEPGWQASDDQDGDLSKDVVVTGDSVDVNQAGTYVKTYTVSDKAGNTTSRDRTIHVVNTSVNRGGTYMVTDTVDITTSQVETYQVELLPSSTLNNVVGIANFRNKGSQSILNIVFQGLTMITVNPQNPDMGTGFEGSVVGSGQVMQDQLTLRIGYQIDYNSIPDKTGIMMLHKN